MRKPMPFRCPLCDKLYRADYSEEWKLHMHMHEHGIGWLDSANRINGGETAVTDWGHGKLPLCLICNKRFTIKGMNACYVLTGWLERHIYKLSGMNRKRHLVQLALMMNQ